MEQQVTRARVISVQKNFCTLSTPSGDAIARVSGKLRQAGEFPVVGDYVTAAPNPAGESRILSIEPRRSYFSRPDRGGHADGYVKTLREQPIIANFDYVFIITSLNDDFSVNRICRYAATTVSGGGIPVAVLTKSDLAADPGEYVARVHAINPLLQVIPVSAYTGDGMEIVRSFFRPGVTIALLGSSGAGKSTLINTLAGREIMRVSEIRASDSKGRHTTTSRQLIDLFGASIIDTPGMRELGVFDVEEGIDGTFSDIADLTRSCRFSDCRYDTEPGCAIRAALESGELSQDRWEAYRALQKENDWSLERKHDFMVEVSKWRKNFR